MSANPVSAFPSHFASEEISANDPRNRISGGGLTKREYFAAAALTGLLANSVAWGEYESSTDFAEVAYTLADAMIAEGAK